MAGPVGCLIYSSSRVKLGGIGERLVARAKRFEATLEKGDRALGWTIARVPLDPAEAWTERLRLRVKGLVNGFGFRTSLFPDPARPGRFYLLVNRAMQEGGGVRLGAMADFRLEPDLEPRPAELPGISSSNFWRPAIFPCKWSRSLTRCGRISRFRISRA